jgi:hypothetical protein
MRTKMTSSAKLRPYAVLLLLPLLPVVLFPYCSKDNPQAPDTTGIVTVDTVPPCAITDLMVRQETSNSLLLLWSAPGDDNNSGQASRYAIRYSSSVINDQNWDAAHTASEIPSPQIAGQIESFALNGLGSAKSYYVAIKSYDEEENESPLSNCISGTTKNESMPPAPVMDLKATALSESEILLTWTAPGDDGTVGTASRYDIRYEIHLLTFKWGSADTVTGEPPPKPGGELDSFIVTGLDPNNAYQFAMKSYDEMPNESELSNITLAMGYNVYIVTVPGSVPVWGSVDIHFKASTPEVLINISRIRYYNPLSFEVFKHYKGYYTEGSHVITWDLTSDDGNPTNYGIQYYVDLYWGDAKKDSVTFRVVG